MFSVDCFLFILANLALFPIYDGLYLSLYIKVYLS